VTKSFKSDDGHRLQLQVKDTFSFFYDLRSRERETGGDLASVEIYNVYNQQCCQCLARI